MSGTTSNINWCLQPPHTQRLIKILMVWKRRGCCTLRLSHRLALVNLYLRISNQLAHVMRYYIRVRNTQSTYIYCICKGGDCDIKSPTWTFRLRYLLIVLKSLPDFQLQKINVRKRPFLMSWRWCLHEALPYAHQTNMSWKHSPTHGLTAFKGKAKKKIWNKQRKLWKNAKKHTVCEHKLIHDIVSSMCSKTTTDFFSTTDWTDGTDFIKADLYFLFLNTNHSNRTNLCSIVGGSFRITFTDVKPLQPDNA